MHLDVALLDEAELPIAQLLLRQDEVLPRDLVRAALDLLVAVVSLVSTVLLQVNDVKCNLYTAVTNC